jgi:DNA-binding HxlR family transcriptional regulator
MTDCAKSLAEATIRMLGDRWKVQIIECLMDGTKRFGELKKELGDITQKVLTTNLRMLEENGILVRHVYAQIPPRVDYTLTSAGYNLKPVIDSMIAWAEQYRSALVAEFNDKLEQGKANLENKINKLKENF